MSGYPVHHLPDRASVSLDDVWVHLDGLLWHVDQDQAYELNSPGPEPYIGCRGPGKGFDPSLEGLQFTDTAWRAVDGLSGQYGYSGPVMHPSEFLSTAQLRALPNGVYTISSVEFRPCKYFAAPEGFDEDAESCPECINDYSGEGWVLCALALPHPDNPDKEYAK